MAPNGDCPTNYRSAQKSGKSSRSMSQLQQIDSRNLKSNFVGQRDRTVPSKRKRIHETIAALVSAAGLLSGLPWSPPTPNRPRPRSRSACSPILRRSILTSAGQGNVEATKMAIEEFGGTMFGKPIELIAADVQNKADIAASLARKWYENEGVDMIIDMPTSATALAGHGDVEAVPEDHDRDGRGELRHHRQILLALHRALDLRHLCQRPHGRQRHRQERRR